MGKGVKSGRVTLEIKVRTIEKILNLLWKEEIQLIKIQKIDKTTMVLQVRYVDYEDVIRILVKCGGKYKVLKEKGNIFIFKKLKKRSSVLIGGIVSIGIFYYLSTYVWVIDIQSGTNVSPYELRKELFNIGVKPGIKKKDINVYEIEEKLESKNRNLLWTRARKEGSSLKVIFEEKINPPIFKEDDFNPSIARIDGEIKRIYIKSGTAAISVGDIVKSGDILINPIEGKEGTEFESPAEGVVIANTFYEKEMEVQVSGKKLVRNGSKKEEIYVKISNYKFYIKKATNNFDNYDKIEECGSFFNTIEYYEKVEEEINTNKDDAINKCVESLKESLQKELINNSSIIDKSIYTEEKDEGKLRVIVTFLVEQDIAVN